MKIYSSLLQTFNLIYYNHIILETLYFYLIHNVLTIFINTLIKSIFIIPFLLINSNSESTENVKYFVNGKFTVYSINIS